MERDLVLAPNEFAYISDQTKGHIQVYTGPHKASLSATDVPQIFDDRTKKFERCELSESIRTFKIAPEGWYVQLKNPSEKNSHPQAGSAPGVPKLDIGRKINIPGPVSFALWPGQMAKVIQGHRLKSNQFLLVRVYDDTAAQQWLDHGGEVPIKDAESEDEPKIPAGQHHSSGPGLRRKLAAETKQLAIGQLIIIKGTDVAFFIPPTGLEVLPDEDGNFVREAVSLERLEYCLLLDQNGKKRYLQGPDVIFPKPTEKFVTQTEKDGTECVKFRAIELNPNSGIYIKVIEKYTGIDPETGKEREFKQGEELFITGDQQRIYFPREEHAIVKYSGEQIHFGTAMPKGEGRYVLDRDEGTIEIVRGPQIFLPDPRRQVIVRRVLTPEACALMYPGNSEAMSHNQALTARLNEQKTMERFADDDTDGLEAHRLTRGGRSRTKGGDAGTMLYASANFLTADVRPAAAGVFGDSLERRSEYTKPRTITLNNKYDGVVTVSPWTGFAIMVVNKAGQRKVVEGPATCMLEYDEELQPLVLSAGRPKGTAKPKKTVYLQVHNNRVSDIVSVETNDFTQVEITLSYRVRFVGEDKEKWFAVANYTKLLSDHMRSKIRREAMTHNIEEFYRNAVDIIRQVVLGAQDGEGQRPMTTFEENNMQIYDVEILQVNLVDPQIAALLGDAQKESITQVVQLARAKRNLETIKQTEVFRREEKDAQDATRQHEVVLTKAGIKDDLAIELDRCSAAKDKRIAEVNVENENQKLNDVRLAIQKSTTDQDIALKQAESQLASDRLMAEARAMQEKMKAVSPQLVAALQGFADKITLQALASSLSPFGMIDMIRGKSMIGSFKRLLEGSPLAESLPTTTTPEDEGGNGRRPQPRR